MIKQTGSVTWKLYDRTGKRHLGTFRSESAALRREAEIRKIKYLKAHGIPPALHSHMSHKPFHGKDGEKYDNG